MRFILALIITCLMAVNIYAEQITTNYELSIPGRGDRDWLEQISRDILSIDAIMGIMSHDTTMNIDILSSDVDDLIKTRVNPSNLLSNADFETWTAGAAVAPDSWTWTPSGANTIARESTNIHSGTYSAKITRTVSFPYLAQSVHATKGISYWQGKEVTFSIWVKCDTAAAVYVYIRDGVGTSQAIHSGSGEWELLTVNRTINAAATELTIRLQMEATASAYFDDCYFAYGNTMLFSTDDGIGIFTDSPRAELDVIGAISADAISIDSTLCLGFTSNTLAVGGEVGTVAILSGDTSTLGYIKLYSLA